LKLYLTLPRGHAKLLCIVPILTYVPKVIVVVSVQFLHGRYYK